MNICPFCEIKNSKTAVLPLGFNHSINITNKVLLESNDLIVIPDICPVIPHHLMIIPRDHFFSCRVLGDELSNQLFELQTKIKSYYSFQLGKEPFFFEHGSCDTMENNSACVEHAHLHSIPISGDDFIVLRKAIFDRLGSPGLGKKNSEGYLFFSFRNETYYWEDNKMFKQFFRDTISRTIGEYNRRIWQICLYAEELYRSLIWEKELIVEWERYGNGN